MLPVRHTALKEIFEQAKQYFLECFRRLTRGFAPPHARISPIAYFITGKYDLAVAEFPETEKHLFGFTCSRQSLPGYDCGKEMLITCKQCRCWNSQGHCWIAIREAILSLAEAEFSTQASAQSSGRAQ